MLIKGKTITLQTYLIKVKTITLQMYSDPGHGWVKYAKSKLQKLGIATKISIHSYQKNEYAFLEKDRDLKILIDALRAKGYGVKFREVSVAKNYSRIRLYDRYMSGTISSAWLKV
jgi:pyruvate/2-oxoglutarate dehydrogenase complex dihydrolipoamide dehydrogenase (E3) component